MDRSIRKMSVVAETLWHGAHQVAGDGGFRVADVGQRRQRQDECRDPWCGDQDDPAVAAALSASRDASWGQPPGNAVSAVLFVVAAGQTSRDVAQLALDRLSSVQAYVAGVVLNKFKPDPKTEYYYAPQDYSVQVSPR